MIGQGDDVVIAAGRLRGLRRVDPRTGRASIAFHGIPFARHPQGVTRFAPPEPPSPWTGLRDARHPADIAHNGLHVNVFTPDIDAALPVLLWIHGGGFTSGSPLDEQLDGMTLNRAGIVLVSASYRLGLEGFGHVDGAAGNRGVRDWIAALQWVQQNIAAFGGDPDQVTIGGHSAGAGAALTLLGMPSAQHLFQRVLSLSAAIGEVPLAQARQRAHRLARLAGVTPDAAGFSRVPSEHLHAQLSRAASARRGLAATAERLEGGLPWGPVVDHDLIPGRVLESIKAGVGADKPLLIGAADDEFTPGQDRRRHLLRLIPVDVMMRRFIPQDGTRRAYLRANAAQRRKGRAALLGRLVSDRICRVLVPQIAALRDGGPAATWTYRFTWPSPATDWSSHTLDIPFWFDGLGKPRARGSIGDEAPQSLSDAMHGALISFIRAGDPGWPQWRSDRPITQIFGDAPRLSDRAFDSVLPLIHAER